MWVAVSGFEIIFQSDRKAPLEKFIDKMCNDFPDVFRREYITIMLWDEYAENIP